MDLYGDPCRDCGFDWSLTSEEAVAAVLAVPDRCAELLRGRTGAERHPDLGWSAAAYVSHVADNLAMWAGWVAAARLDGVTVAPGYDPDALAAARRYEVATAQSSVWWLHQCAAAWAAALGPACDAGVELQHARRGRQRAQDVARNNAHDAHHHVHDVRRILAWTPAG